MDCVLRGVGSASMTSRWMTSVRAALCTSTMGASPETVTVSSRAPTDSAPLMVTLVDAWTSMPSCTKVEKPGSVMVTL